MFHIAHKKNDEKNLMTYHHKLDETTADQHCLAAIHFLRSHFEEATDIYKKLLLENREFLAINCYVALCCYVVAICFQCDSTAIQAMQKRHTHAKPTKSMQNNEKAMQSNEKSSPNGFPEPPQPSSLP